MTRITGRIKYLPVFAMMLACSSCDSNLIYTDAWTIPDASWNMFEKAEFNFTVADTSKSSNLFLTLRTGSQYPYRNIFLFATTTAPGGKNITDTLEFQLSDERGKRLGKGFSDIYELKLPYKINVVFPVRGTYNFQIRHGMRDPDLKGVYDIGLRIENFMN
jgi:gliding motility-associated lipoprotein GldH